MEGDRKAVLARIVGRVQGVGFRFWTRTEAEKLGLAGWVRNEADGSVTALIAGPDAAVSAMISRLREGPPGAAVAAVSAEEVDPADTPSDFRIAR